MDRIGRKEPARVRSTVNTVDGQRDTAKAAAGEDAQDRADEIADAKCKHADTRVVNGGIRICSTCGNRVS